jgi:hypothetical protein
MLSEVSAIPREATPLRVRDHNKKGIDGKPLRFAMDLIA